MSLLIYSGLLYLLGISIILMLKPELMFSKDGKWKEFGLGRNHETHTWIPFWLFAILWAIVSYVIVLVIASHTGMAGVTNNTDIPIQNEVIERQNVSMKALKPVLNESPAFEVPPQITTNSSLKKKAPSNDMKHGYYILDTNETMKKGMPKYIYLGPEAPNLVYHNITMDQEQD